MRATDPEVFVLESLTLQNELDDWFEGDTIARQLRLTGKKGTHYYYIRTKRELQEMLKLFGASRCRYLHISCHANSSSMETTFDQLSFYALGKMLRPYLTGRRVFVSGCQMASDDLARHLFRPRGCSSLIGPRTNIDFDDSTAFWPAFYHLMFKETANKMTKKQLAEKVSGLSALFGVEMNYFTSDGLGGYERVEI